MVDVLLAPVLDMAEEGGLDKFTLFFFAVEDGVTRSSG